MYYMDELLNNFPDFGRIKLSRSLYYPLVVCGKQTIRANNGHMVNVALLKIRIVKWNRIAICVPSRHYRT